MLIQVDDFQGAAEVKYVSISIYNMYFLTNMFFACFVHLHDWCSLCLISSMFVSRAQTIG